MELEILYIISMIISFVCIVVQRNHNKWLFDKLKSKTSENERHTPIDTSSLKKSCEDKIVGDKIIWDVPYSKYREKYKKITEPIYNEFNYNFYDFEVSKEKEENNKMNKKQLEKRLEEVYTIAKDYSDEVMTLRKELSNERNNKRIEYVTATKTELFIATQEEIEKAKCCETCEAFITNFRRTPFQFDKYQDSCKKNIIASYKDVDIEETKCKEHKCNEKKLINKIKEMRADKEHTERVKKAKPTIVRIDKKEK